MLIKTSTSLFDYFLSRRLLFSLHMGFSASSAKFRSKVENFDSGMFSAIRPVEQRLKYFFSIDFCNASIYNRKIFLQQFLENKHSH